MADYAIQLPTLLREEAERLAQSQGVSLDHFILWALSEKVNGLRHRLHDARFPGIEYRIGAAGWPTPVIQGTGIRVQTLVIAQKNWGLSAKEIAEEYGVALELVEEALAFYASHQREIDADIAVEVSMEESAIA